MTRSFGPAGQLEAQVTETVYSKRRTILYYESCQRSAEAHLSVVVHESKTYNRGEHEGLYTGGHWKRRTKDELGEEQNFK